MVLVNARYESKAPNASIAERTTLGDCGLMIFLVIGVEPHIATGLNE